MVFADWRVLRLVATTSGVLAWDRPCPRPRVCFVLDGLPCEELAAVFCCLAGDPKSKLSTSLVDTVISGISVNSRAPIQQSILRLRNKEKS
ncbi:hypothetical protein DPMN_122630 [Dreissena polymorpha]|uniref:Uncharacterized protein n=1 Tax=Dreissena polymorpha TaxID=45954 RepID=A0A9D4JQR0_DREPO|nr:hypothetical protein DPMN_122630 [Dreissena polymorpha]